MRQLRPEERALIAAMVRGQAAEDVVLQCIEDAVVQEMDDGGMGSIRFVRQPLDKPRFATQIREATFADMDGVPVSITINVDQDGYPFELDVWKADYSPLKRFPTPRDVSIR